MTAHRYTNIGVSSHINVSSSGHYFAAVFYMDAKQQQHGRRDFSISEKLFLSKHHGYMGWTAPDYLVRKVTDRLRQIMTDGTAVYYECDRDGNERTADLRYYDADHARWLAEHL